MLDADDGGRARRAQLIENNIPDDRILLLVDDTDIEIEDLIAPETYVHGVQRYLDDVGASRRLRKVICPLRPAGGTSPFKLGARRDR